MRGALLISEFLSTPWALMPERVAAFSRILARWSAGGAAPPEVLAGVRADHEAREARRESAQRAGKGAIAVLPMYGVVTQRGNMADDISGPGSMSTQRFTQAFRDALADQTVGGILIDVDSPGGSVYGVQELFDEIYGARGQKPVVAVANSLAASAGYWLPCAADEFYCTPSGEVGSVGVWSAHEDWSKALEESGIKTTLVSAGKFKTEGNYAEPLGDEARAHMQKRVDEYYTMFTRGVAKGRGVPVGQVRDGMGQGRVLGPQDAVEQKMIDGVATFDDAVKRLTKLIRGDVATSARGARRIDVQPEQPAQPNSPTTAVPDAPAAADSPQPPPGSTVPAVSQETKPNHAARSRRELDQLGA